MVEWTHLCDYAFYDQTQKVCLIGLFKAIHTTGVPAQHPRCNFVFALTGSPNEAVSLRFQVIGPDGREPLVDFTNREVNLNQAGEMVGIVALNNLSLPSFGLYEVRVTINGQESHASTFLVQRGPTGALLS